MTELATGAITVGDLYRELVGMRSDLSKVLAHQEAVDTRNRNADQVHLDHETRLRGLERFRYTLGGLAVLGGGLAGLVGDYIGQHLH